MAKVAKEQGNQEDNVQELGTTVSDEDENQKNIVGDSSDIDTLIEAVAIGKLNDDEMQEEVVELEIEESEDDEEETAAAEEETVQKGSSKSTPREKKVTTASKTARRKIYKSEKVFKLDKDDNEENEEVSQKHEDFLNLVASVKSKKILSGTVVGCRKTTEGPIAEVSFGTYDIIIPATEMLRIPDDIQKSPELPGWLIKQLNYRLGATIDFIVRGVDEKKGIAVASRLDAMYAKSDEHYVARQGGKAKISAGDIAQGRITSVAGIGIVVEVFGSECFIKQEEISYNRLAEVDEIYNVGDTVNVRVIAVNPVVIEKKVFENGATKIRKVRTIVIEASVKQAGEDPRVKYFDDFQEDANCLATVTQVTDKGIYVNLRGKMDALCPLPKSGKMPTRGSKVLVKIGNKDSEHKLIYGFINKVINLA